MTYEYVRPVQLDARRGRCRGGATPHAHARGALRAAKIDCPDASQVTVVQHTSGFPRRRGIINDALAPGSSPAKLERGLRVLYSSCLPVQSEAGQTKPQPPRLRKQATGLAGGEHLLQRPRRQDAPSPLPLLAANPHRQPGVLGSGPAGAR